MTLDEARARADAGEVSAMMALGNYYANDKSSEDSINIAYEWYQKAAEAGDSDAILKMAKSSYEFASAMLPFLDQGGTYKDMVRIMENSHKWTKKLVQNMSEMGIQGSALNDVTEFYTDSIVWLSAVYSLDKNYTGIKQITEMVSFPAVRALYGFALYELGSTDNELNTAFVFLEAAMHPDFWSNNYGGSLAIEMLRGGAAATLSAMYRVLRRDNNAARDALATCLKYTTNPELRAALQEDMSHYKKTIFGGYRYVD